VHLYLFGGQPAAAEETWVVSYQVAPDGAGRLVKQVTEARRFERLDDALAHSASLGQTPHAVVGRDPMRPCVPLPRREGFLLAYETNDAERTAFGRPSVRIFERDAPP
jgi:hypothetical protein